MATAVEEKYFFEGTEKLLEVWFSSSDSSKDGINLRSIERGHWEELLKLVQCEIISVVSDEDMDAYVLSESSMFVTSHRFILKTCGQTTLLLAVEPLLKLVDSKCGFDKVQDIFYSRKNFTRPDKQHKIHQKFEDEQADGRRFALGSAQFPPTILLDAVVYVKWSSVLFGTNEQRLLSPNVKNVQWQSEGTDTAVAVHALQGECWLPCDIMGYGTRYLYTIDCIGVMDPDQTLELLMWDMDQDKMKIFSKETCANGKETSEKSGISELIPGAQIDDFLFHPCGYSMNGLLPGITSGSLLWKGASLVEVITVQEHCPMTQEPPTNAAAGYYITIHVTPEPHCSYVSFETNVPQKSYHDLMKKILEVFSPGKFLMTIFANQESIAKDSPKDFENMTSVKGYMRNDHQHCLFKNYSLTYTHFSRPVL